MNVGGAKESSALNTTSSLEPSRGGDPGRAQGLVNLDLNPGTGCG